MVRRTSERASNDVDEALGVKSEPGWIRTIDTCLKRAVLYQLSYGLTKVKVTVTFLSATVNLQNKKNII